MRKQRRNHSPSFKAKVALAAFKGDKTLSELSSEFGVHANQVTQWKKQLMTESADLFQRGAGKSISETEIEKLHNKIGRLTMENEFLSKALGH